MTFHASFRLPEHVSVNVCNRILVRRQHVPHLLVYDPFSYCRTERCQRLCFACWELT